MLPVLAFRHVPHEPLGLLEEVLRGAGLVYSYVDLFDSPPRRFSPDLISGLVVLGGSMNVDEIDRHRFLAAETRWIEEAIATNTPVLGICLGAQLIAKALGAPVYPMGRREIGWGDVTLTAAAEDDLLFSGCPKTFAAFHWHGDAFEIPLGAVQLARSALCDRQAFRFGRNVYALQFHLETTTAIIGDWLQQPVMLQELEDVEELSGDSLRQEALFRIEDLNELGRKVFGRFAELCQERARS